MLRASGRKLLGGHRVLLDRLKSGLLKKHEEAQIDSILDQAYASRGKDIHNSIALANTALQQCSDTQYPDGKAKAQNLLGLFHLVRGEFEIARSLSESALAYFTETQNLKGIADANYNLASILYRTNDYHQGLRLMLDCLKAYRSLNDLHNQARTLIPIGTIYEYFGDYQHASDAYQQCVEISKTLNDGNLESNAYNPLAGIYLKQQKPEQAFELIQKSIAIKKEIQDNRGLAFAHYIRGKIHLRKKEYEKAMNDFTVGLHITSSASDRLGQGMVLNKMGITHFEQHQFDQARQCFLEAEQVSKQYNITFVLAKAHYNLYLLAKAEQRYDEALGYYEQSNKMKDAVVNKETFNIIKSYDILLKVEALEHEARLQKEKNSIIEQKNAELDSFFYRVSHDLKGPISSLLGLNNLVKMDIRDNTSLRFFELYHEQVRRMNNIVMGLINLTEINNTKELNIPIDFDILVEECIRSCHYLDQSSRVIVKKCIEPITYTSEWAIINTILQNLIENAIKYSRHDIEPVVHISIRAEGEEICIRVEDNGQGIPARHINLIFDMFYRANDQVKGSGLGLYILKRAVERLKGTIAVTSTPAVGSVFTVRLPLHR